MSKQMKDTNLDASVETPKTVQGPPWAKVGVYQTFEEADKKRFEVIANNPTFKAKVKRCGDGGSLFMVKKREDPELAKISKEIDETAKKNSKKLSQKKKKTKPTRRIQSKS